MTNTLRYGKATYISQDSPEPQGLVAPTPVIRFNQVYAEGRYWTPRISDRAALQLLKRKMPKRVSFMRAYRGFRASGSSEERELGEGRALLRWLMKHELSIEWEFKDLCVHPYFTQPDAPRHDENDEMAQGMSFAVAPVEIEGRKVKLYLVDEDVLRLIHLKIGPPQDFLELIKQYVLQRYQWAKWSVPAPGFIDWLTTQGHTPQFHRGQLGFKLPV